VVVSRSTVRAAALLDACGVEGEVFPMMTWLSAVQFAPGDGRDHMCISVGGRG